MASLESGASSNDAIPAKNDAVLNQSLASDQRALYQAKTVRAAIASGESEFASATNPELANRFRDEAARLKSEQAPLETKARGLERRVEGYNLQAERLLCRHHHFAISVTLFQVAVALCAIAALTKRKPLWGLGLAASVVGVALFVAGLLAPMWSAPLVPSGVPNTAELTHSPCGAASFSARWCFLSVNVILQLL